MSEAPEHKPEAAALAAPVDEREAERLAALEAGRLLFARPCRFVFASQRLDQLPEARRPEGALALLHI